MTTFAGPPLETEEGIGALTLGGLLIETCARHRDREALVFHRGDEVTRWTYADLERESRRVARALLATGQQKGGRVAVLMGTCPQWVAAYFGVALTGGVLVPVNTYFEAGELDHVLRHCDASLLLTQEQLLGHRYLDVLAELCPELAAAEPGALRSPAFPFLRRVVALGASWDEWLALGDEIGDELVDAAAAEVSPADDAMVIYTSGTTATPKGVLHAHRAAAIQSWRFVRHLALTPDARIWSAYPYFWTAGLSMVLGATLAGGACLVLQEFFEPGEALRLMETEQVSGPRAWPHQVAQLEDHPDWAKRDLSHIRDVESFSSFARHPTVHVGDRWSPRAAYGLTETFTIVTSLPADSDPAVRDTTTGAVLPGNELRILDPVSGLPLPANQEGEIVVRGATLMKGYLKVPFEESVDAEGFFHSGDAGFVDDAGYLHWTGRVSDLIKTGGANVSPVEIETVLLQHPGLKAALAVGVPDPTLGELVVVCAVAHDAAVVDEDDVRGFLRGKVASYKVPKRVLFFREDELSLTGSAKIRTDELRALAAKRLAADTA